MPSVTESNTAATTTVSGSVTPTTGGSPVVGVTLAGRIEGNVGTAVRGTYGWITVAADGSYTYVLDNTDRDTNAIGAGQVATDRFTYTYRQGGSVMTGSIAVDITGVAEDGEVIRTFANPQAYNADAAVGANERWLFADLTSPAVAITAPWQARPVLTNNGTIETQSFAVSASYSSMGWSASVLNNGRIQVSTSRNELGAVGLSDGGGFSVNTGVVQVRSTSPGRTPSGGLADQAQASGAAGLLRNDGLVEAISRNGPVVGVTVLSALPVIGYELPGFTNTGFIYAEGGGGGGTVYAKGVFGAGSGLFIDNRGTIQAVAPGTSRSVGIDVFPNNSNVYAAGTILNSGRIIADVAIQGVEGYNNALTITNTGYIEGALNRSGGLDVVTNAAGALWRGSLSTGRDAALVRNRGTIEGDVLLAAGGDMFDGRGGTITGWVYGGTGSDVLYAGVSGAGLDGGDGDDVLVGGSGADVLTGGAGSDSFVYTAAGGSHAITDFRSGVDRIDLGRLGVTAVSITGGGDRWSVEAETAGGRLVIAVTGAVARSDLILAPPEPVQRGGDGDNVLLAGTGGAALHGGAAHDVLVGEAGSDVLDGGVGNDTMMGGAGDDVYYVDADGDRIIEAPGEGFDEVRSTADYSLQAWVENGTLLGTANVGLGGNGQDNVLRGNGGNNLLYGYGGNDTLIGGAGADTLDGGVGRNVFVYERPSDSTERSMDYLTRFQHGLDLVDLSAVAPVSFTFERFENYWSGSNYTTVYIYTESGAGMVIRLDGAATMADFIGVPIRGTPNNDVLVGTAGNDLLDGLAGNDRIDGLAGDDVLVGHLGADTLTGGAGKDVFRGTRAQLAGDTVVDLSLGDRIHVSDAGSGFAVAQAGTTLTFSTGETMTLANGVRVTTRAAADGGTDIVMATPVENDWNGDGRSDVMWRNAGGYVTTWVAAGSGFDSATGFGITVGNDWKIAGNGDFTGDGRSDMLWRNDNGRVTTWASTGNGFNGATGVDYYVGTEWKVGSVGDFNGDGRADILWRNDNGRITTWASTGTGFDGATGVDYYVGSDWMVAGSGDTNGDGRDDIVWRNDNGRVTVWLGTATGFNGASGIDYQLTSDWKVAGVADFNGDGRDDILWRNDNGRLTQWFASPNGGFAQGSFNSVVATAWAVADTGDYNGDGRADILWRNADGTLAEWLSNGTGFDANPNVNVPVPTDWTVFG